MTIEQRLCFWKDFNARRGNSVAAYQNPAERDVTRLRSQLEPWSTQHLRLRLSATFGEDDIEMDSLPRGEIMEHLLQHYEKRPRRTLRIMGSPVSMQVCQELLIHLQAWSQIHKVNSRPSICASNYMILRSPSEFASNEDGKGPSKKARIAAKKLHEFQHLWDLAKKTLAVVDAEYADSFSALAVTKNFTGSPHIDKQNTGPFYGLSLGNFDDGTGGVCVEANAFTVAHVNTKHRLGKVDGRYPHWVAPYSYNRFDKNATEKVDEERCRYSLIFYSTKNSYLQPGPAYFGEAAEEAQ